jgi:long-chain acyl-CoA synthetase
MAETLVSRFFANADRLGARTMHSFPANGRWVPVGWRAAARLVRDAAGGLLELGHEPGNALAIISGTRREWMLCDLANLALGGITVGVYPTMTPDQTRYVVAHCDARFAIVEDQQQLAKLESVRAQLPRLEHVIVIDPAGATGKGVLTLASLLSRGRGGRHDIERRAASLELEDAATFIYTSGTTGPPKGAMLTHGNIVAACKAGETLALDPGSDVGFSFLPLAHALQRACDYQAIWRGVSGAYGRSLDTVAEDFVVTRPTLIAAVPRIFEKVYARIHDQAAKQTPQKQRIFRWALKIGRDVSKIRQLGGMVPPRLRVEYALAKRLVYDKLRDRLGGRMRLMLTGGAPIAVEILEFFDAAGITILEGWGMTETFALGTLNVPGKGGTKFGSIGRPLPGVEMKLDDDGEILVRGPNVFSGYYKDDDATRAAFTSDGYFRTGDIGRVDSDGFFTIVDRKKDLIITAAGKNIAPQNIENLLKGDPRISQVMLVGDRRPYLVALIAVAPDARLGLSDADVHAMVAEIVSHKNEELASYERVKAFRLLPHELTQEAGELTPTLKVKRKVVSEKYAALIDSMYDGQAHSSKRA